MRKECNLLTNIFYRIFVSESFSVSPIFCRWVIVFMVQYSFVFKSLSFGHNFKFVKMLHFVPHLEVCKFRSY